MTEEHGLTVIHTGASRPRPMAEFTLGRILSSLMHIHNYHHDMRSGEAWPRLKYPRGRMVCEQDMVEALAERDLYLALDVFEQEPLPADSPLR